MRYCTNTYYICSGCLNTGGFLSGFVTGGFLDNGYHSGALLNHSASRYDRNCHSVFLDTGREAYISGAQYISQNSFCAKVTPNGRVNRYAVFPSEIASVEQSGCFVCNTTTGQMVYSTDTGKVHWFGYGRQWPAALNCHFCGGAPESTGSGRE